jgi:beta-exotoxin I transport system ATP-binding protein
VAAVVETSGLTKRYGAVRGIDDVSLAVEQGTVFGLLGPNGAGKSTLIRTLLDFQRATSGRAALFGLDSRRDSVAIHRRTGYLPGELVLFDKLTAREHLRTFARARGAPSTSTVDALVERFRIELDRPVRSLSKGNKQKVGVLLAFAGDPELLVLDEPTSGLDPLMQEQFHHLLRETAAAGRTVLLSSHSLDEVQRVADRVTLLKEGRVLVTDTIEALQARAPQVVELEFADRVDASAFAGVGGVVDARDEGRRVRLRVVGPLDAVIKAAARHETTALSAAPADLEELFLDYFEESPDARR